MLSYEVHGSGAPLILVHGLTHRRQAWYPVLEHLTGHREVFLIDLPGHGESPELAVGPDGVQPAIREALVETMDALGLDRPHIAGNSLGGRVALEAGADNLVRSVTTLSPAAFWHGSLDFAYVRLLFAWLTSSARLLSPVSPLLVRSPRARHLMTAAISDHGERLTPEELLGDLRAMRRAIPAMREIFPAAEQFDRPIPADIPVTIAWAEHDHVLRPYQAGIAARQMPDARHLVLTGCGHVPMADDPQQVAAVLLAGSEEP